jgi:hypothetical protein
VGQEGQHHHLAAARLFVRCVCNMWCVCVAAQHTGGGSQSCTEQAGSWVHPCAASSCRLVLGVRRACVAHSCAGALDTNAALRRPPSAPPPPRARAPRQHPTVTCHRDSSSASKPSAADTTLTPLRASYSDEPVTPACAAARAAARRLAGVCLPGQ